MKDTVRSQSKNARMKAVPLYGYGVQPSRPFPLPSPLFSWREKQNLDHPICECSITLGVAVLRESWDVAEGGLLDMLVAGGGAELC